MRTSVDILGTLAHLTPSDKALDIYSKIRPPNPFKQSRCCFTYAKMSRIT